MTNPPIHHAGEELDALLQRAGVGETVLVEGSHGRGVLISEEQWAGIQETLYILSVPGIREAIMEGMAEPFSEASEAPGW